MFDFDHYVFDLTHCVFDLDHVLVLGDHVFFGSDDHDEEIDKRVVIMDHCYGDCLGAEPKVKTLTLHKFVILY